jgi:hypothetical protein
MRARSHSFEQVIGQQQIEHGGFIHHQKIQIERIIIIMVESFQRGKLEETMNGAGGSFSSF